MSTKHPPGEWFASPTGNGKMYDIGADDGSNVCLVYASDGDVLDAATGHANARLLAAAPDLLRAGQDVLASTDHTMLEASTTALRSAIKKATGENHG